MHERVLIVDDEPQMALAMRRTLERDGFRAEAVEGGDRALEALNDGRYDVVVTDLRMPGMDGRTLLKRIRARATAPPVVVVTAHGSVGSAVACMRDGASDFLMKPFSPDDLRETVRGVLRGALEPALGEDEPLACDPLTRQTLELARRAAGSDATVLLEAESGAGKEVFARWIHARSARARGAFVAVNCAALPRELLEAELFGHVRGAFTGAHRDHKGVFRMADGGTLLLDEIGEMSPDLQARLLRVLQDQQVRPVGAEQSVKVDVRVIAATNRDLRTEVREGRFREDLYYRLRVLPLRIPALRERPADVEPLARRFAAQFGRREEPFAPAALAALASHAWPGNVRELRNVVHRATILAGDSRIEPEHLDLEPALREPAGGGALSLEEAEREAIRRTLERTGGNRNAAAAALGISPRTLRHKLKRYRDDGRPIEERN